jgi:hypothetical protein
MNGRHFEPFLGQQPTLETRIKTGQLVQLGKIMKKS